MDLQFKTFPFEVKAGAADGSTFEGLVSVFNNVDAYGEIVDPGAFDQDLPDFMANGFIGGLNHDWDNPIGKPQPGTKVVDNGLHLVGNVLDTSHGMDVRKMLANGVVKKLSIGFRTLGDMMLEDADECMAYWESKGYKPSAQDMARCQRGARVLTRIQLFEGSPVTLPANDLATITAVKAAREAAQAVYKAAEPAKQTDRLELIRSISAPSDAEDILRDAGFSGTERKALISCISRLKSLPRDVVGDDAGTPLEDVVVSDPADETPAQETKNDAEPTPPAPETIVTPATTDDAPQPLAPPAPLAKELASASARVIEAQLREQMRLRSLIYGDAARS